MGLPPEYVQLLLAMLGILRFGGLDRIPCAPQSAAPLQNLVGEIEKKEVRGGLRPDAEQFLDRLGLASRAHPVGYHGQCKRRRAGHSGLAVNQKRPLGVLTREFQHRTDMVRARQSDGFVDYVDVLEAQDQMIGMGRRVIPQPVPPTGILHGHDRADLALDPACLTKGFDDDAPVHAGLPVAVFIQGFDLGCRIRACQGKVPMPDWKFRIDRELQEVAEARDGYLALVERATRESGRGLLRANAPTRLSTFRSMDRQLVAALRPLRSRYDETPTRSGRSSGLEVCHVALMPDRAFNGRGHLSRLVAVRFALLPDEIEVELVPLHACIRPHAAERFLERGDFRIENATRHVAGNMLEWLMVPFLVDDALDRLDLTRLSVPGGDDELLLGYMDRTCPLPVGEMFRIRGGRRVRVELPASPYEPGVYVVNTFLGRMEMKHDHYHLHEAMTRWRDACGPAYWSRLEDGLWQNRALKPPVPGASALPEGSGDAIRELCTDETSVSAMQSVRPAREPDDDGLHTFEQIEREFYGTGDATASPMFR